MDENNSSPTKGYGVYITHAEGWQTVYWHFWDVSVAIGQEVKKGDLLGHSDNTGMSAGDHLHWGLYPADPDYNNGYGGAISPMPYLSQEEISGIINTNTMIVDRPILEKLYQAIFKREPDSAALGFIGQDINFVLDEFVKSEEHQYYSALYKAGKEIENNL